MTPAKLPTPEVRVPASSETAAASGPAGPLAGVRGSDADSKNDLLAWAYAEYQRLRQQGKPPNVQAWCALFPACRAALEHLLVAEVGVGAFLDRPTKISADESIDWPVEGDQREGFTILRELARGSFARVYLASEAATGGRLVVVKCSLLGDAEARTMGRLAHPHVMPILSARLDELSGLTMVCMPYLGSATLEDVLERAAPPPSKASFLLEVLRDRAQPEDPPPPRPDPCLLRRGYTDGVIHLAAQLAEALAFLHEHGVCHRDLKPSNVLLDPSGKPLLLDFNMSHSERETECPLGGTVHYMAPEQLRGFLSQSKDGIDERADFYALGVIVYELLGGVHPGASLSTNAFGPALARSILSELNAGFRPFRSLCPELERPVAAMLDRCVALDAARRPANAVELAAALKRQFTPARRLRRWFAAHPLMVLATLCLFLAAAAVLCYIWAVTPPYSEREYERGRTAYRAGDYDAAEQHFDRALRAQPNHSRFRQARGCARLQQSKFLPPDKARFDLILDDLASTEQGATDVRSLAVNAYIQTRKQHFQEAIDKYTNPALAAYRPVMVLNNRAYSYMGKLQWEKALMDLDQAVQLDPHCQAMRYNRIVVALRLRLKGKIPAIRPQSLEDAEVAMRLGPTTSDLYRDAALLYAQAARDDDREARLERALFYLRQAIAVGESPAAFKRFPSLTEAMRRPEFAALLAGQPPQPVPQPELRLVDPVDLPD